MLNGESRCDRCGAGDIGHTSVNVPTSITHREITQYIDFILGEANGYIKSDIPCPWCKDRHYMAYPGIRHKTDYNKVEALTRLPYCPVRIWKQTKHRGMMMPLATLLNELRIED